MSFLKFSLLFGLIFSACISAFAQPIDTLWTRSYGRYHASDECRHLYPTSEGGFALVGNSDAYPDTGNVYFVKTNSLGDTLWTHLYSIYGNPRFMKQTSTGGYIIAGSAADPFSNPRRIFFANTDSNGNLLWTRYYSPDTLSIGCSSVIETSDGGYVIVGTKVTREEGENQAQDKSGLIIRLNANGDSLWSRIYGRQYVDTLLQDDWFINGYEASDGGYILFGSSSTHDTTYIHIESHYFLLRINSAGDTVWNQNYDLATLVWANAFQKVNDNEYIISGTAANGSSIWVFGLIKINSNGNVIWSHTYNIGFNVFCSSTTQTLDGGYALLGTAYDSPPFIESIWIVKTDANGDSLWSKNIIHDDFDDSTLFRLNGSNDVFQVSDSSYVFAATVNHFAPDWTMSNDFLLVKTTPENTNAVNDPFILPPSSFILSAYPNPFNPSTTIEYNLAKSEKVTLKIYDILGQEVKTLVEGNQTAGLHKVEFDGGNLASGIYLARMEISGNVQMKKMMLLK